MLKVPAKNTIITLLLLLSVSQSVCAGVDIYRYDGKLPFIRMMLGMMDAMGVIDKLPSNGMYGGNPYSRYSNNPMLRSPWLQSPWSQTNQYGSTAASPIWGSPDWGVLPMNRYTRNYYSQYGYEYSPYWSQSDLDGWVEEPWETSKWNFRAEQPSQATRQATRAQPAPLPPQQVNKIPLVQNFNFGVPENTRADNRPVNRSPLSKMVQPRQPQQPQQSQQSQQSQQQRQPARPPVTQQGKQSPLAKKNYRRSSQKPCVTEFCGLKKPNLNGLWVSQSGEMLGVNNQRYLWSDGSSRYLTGQLKVQNEYLIASVDDHDQLMRFKYKLSGNHLLTMQPNGTIREFSRMSRDQYKSFGAGGYNKNYSQNYGQNYRRY